MHLIRSKFEKNNFHIWLYLPVDRCFTSLFPYFFFLWCLSFIAYQIGFVIFMHGKKITKTRNESLVLSTTKLISCCARKLAAALKMSVEKTTIFVYFQNRSRREWKNNIHSFISKKKQRAVLSSKYALFVFNLILNCCSN